MLPLPTSLPWLSSYGVLLILALLLGWRAARGRAPRYGVDPSHVDLAVPLLFLLSVIGMRGLALVVDGGADTGIAVHEDHVRFRLFGLLLFAAPLLFAYARLSRQSFRKLADLFALPALLWLATLRIGCFLAGCCWGDLAHVPEGVDAALVDPVLTLPWLSGEWIPQVSFPAGSHAYEQHLQLGLIGADAAASLPVHPTQLYEMTLLLAGFIVLGRRAGWTPGTGRLALVTLGGYAAARFLLEFVRADSAAAWGALNATQIICAAIVLTAFSAGLPGQGFAPRTRTSS